MPGTESWLTLSDKQRAEIRQMIETYPPGAWYKVLAQERIPGVFAPVLKGKCDYAIVMVSNVTVASTVFVCNALRVDVKDGAIDQEPFGVAVIGDQPAQSGLFLHHGSWDGRTVRNVPPEFWGCVASSGVGNHYPFPELPPASFGSLSELKQTSHASAFKEIVERLANYRAGT